MVFSIKYLRFSVEVLSCNSDIAKISGNSDILVSIYAGKQVRMETSGD